MMSESHNPDGSRTVTYDIGRVVLCDLCGKDYTDSEAKGGLLFASKAVCPECVPRLEKDVKAFGEERYIKARAKDGQEFRAFVLELRGGNNTVTVTSFPRRR